MWMSSSLGTAPVILLRHCRTDPGGDEGATRPMISPTLVSKTRCLELAQSASLAGLLAFCHPRPLTPQGGDHTGPPRSNISRIHRLFAFRRNRIDPPTLT
jgi:hypothetical protein